MVSYKFDKVFGPTAQQSDVFDQVYSLLIACLACLLIMPDKLQVAGFVKHAATGQNATIFAYGPTGSGKTHTMQGTHSDRGVIPRAVDALLSHVEKERTEGAWVDHKVRDSLLRSSVIFAVFFNARFAKPWGGVRASLLRRLK